MNSRDLFLLLALSFAAPGCSIYQIPQQEIARLETRVQKKQISEINLEDLFKDHRFPKLKDYFFYLLFHLEQQPGNYLVNRQELVAYAQKHNLNSSIPLEDLEKIVRESGLLKIYTGGFSESIPGSRGLLSLDASENLCFYSYPAKERPSRRLNLVLGSLKIKLNFPLNLVYNLNPEVKKIELYDQGKNIAFYCQCLIDGRLKKSRIIYHSEDNSVNSSDDWYDHHVFFTKK